MLSKGKKWSENGSSGGRGGLLPNHIFLDVLEMEAGMNHTIRLFICLGRLADFESQGANMC